MSKYDVDLDLHNRSSLSIIVDMIEDNSKILEFGPAHGRLTKYLKEEKKCIVDIVEIDDESGSEAKKYANRALVGKDIGDIEKYKWKEILKNEKYDYIIFADVLEHLYYPEEVLKNAKLFLKNIGAILISIPNVAHNSVIIDLINDKFTYTEVGLLDNTHIRFFTYNSLKEMILRCNLIATLENATYSEVNRHFPLPSYGELSSEYLIDVLRNRTYANVYQFVFKLQKKEFYFEANPLVSLNIDGRLSNEMVFYLKTDYDNSYIESKSIRKKISWGENTISIDFSSYSDIDSIRFDPFLDRCVIKLNSIKLSSSKKDDSLILEISNISSNAIFSVGSYYLFNNDDPQFEINLKRSNYNILSIDFYVYKIYETDAINDLLFLLKDKNSLLDINKKYEEERNSLLDINKKYEEERNNLLDINKKYEEERNNLLDMNKKYEEENVILLKIKKEKEYFEKSYHIILNSNSWKITKPIRLILDKIKESSSVNLIKRFLNHLKKYGFMFTFYKVKDYLRRDKACIMKDNNNFMEVITFNGMINYIDNYSEEKESLIYGKEQILEYDNYNINKNIILVSHALDLTGAPSAIVFFAEKLKRDGYNVIVVSPISGRLIDLLYEKGIPVIVYKELFRDNFIQRYCSLFSLVIANTIVSSPIISQLSMSKIRVLWWIHEADTSYHEGQIKSIPQNIGSNVKIYCGGSYAANVFKKYFPQHSTEILLYYIPEITDLFNSDNYKLNYCNTREKIVFVTIGTQEERKGQDILVDAILTLEYEVLKNCYFIFVGKEFYIPIAEKIRFISKKYPNNIKYIPEMNPRDLKTLYYTMDCLICPSKDDPMPIVVTEAFIMKKAVICSENIGQSEYIVDGFNGLLYHNNSCIELSEKIRYFVDNKDRLSRLGVEARKIYDKYFSESAFDNSISRIMNEMNSNLSTPLNISIIIPTYNAGHQFEKMVELLKNQKIDGNIEIIVVDSGSKDITREICVSKEITLIEISNSDFSHSFARNLGAEKSNGDILVFMTQDALPSSHDWLKKLVEPIVSEEITAVSCAESCPEGTDLYYRICSFNHSKYVGFFDKDVVGSISKCNDVDSLRKNSSLNDVSCAIRKDIFMKYRYRFDYAEDLDLGVRLIKDGYKIKILSNLYTIHGHNRNSDYYLKRSLVESKTFPKIFEAVESHENEEIVSSRIVYSYFLVINSILESEKQNITFESTIDFIKKFSFILDNKIRNTKYIKDFKIDSIFNNNEIYNIVSILKQRYNVKFNDSSPYIAMGVRGYLDIVVDYLTLNPVQYSNEIKNSIYDCCIKQLSVITGSELLKLQNDEMILSYINILSKGV